MTDEEVKKVAKEAAHEAVLEIFKRFGVETEDIREAQKDFLYLSKSRKGSEEVARWIKRGCVLSFVSGIIYLIGKGIELAVKQLINGG